MTTKTIKRKLRKINPESAYWQRLANAEARSFVEIVACRHCGGPRVEGYSCNRCGSQRP